MLYFKNIPNILTITRIILIPVFLYFIFFQSVESKIIALIIFLLASLTDLLDGYLARKWEVTTKIGQFLDPLADKALVISALIAFILLDSQIPIWMLVVIIGRDILITAIRLLGRRNNIEVVTSNFAKIKTIVQMITIILILLVFIARSYRLEIKSLYNEGNASGQTNIQIALNSLLEGFDIWWNKEIDSDYKKQVFASSVPYFLLFITTILTAVSGIVYLFTNKQIIQLYFMKYKQKSKILNKSKE